MYSAFRTYFKSFRSVLSIRCQKRKTNPKKPKKNWCLPERDCNNYPKNQFSASASVTTSRKDGGTTSLGRANRRHDRYPHTERPHRPKAKECPWTYDHLGFETRSRTSGESRRHSSPGCGGRGGPRRTWRSPARSWGRRGRSRRTGAGGIRLRSRMLTPLLKKEIRVFLFSLVEEIEREREREVLFVNGQWEKGRVRVFVCPKTVKWRWAGLMGLYYSGQADDKDSQEVCCFLARMTKYDTFIIRKYVLFKFGRIKYYLIL